MYTAKLACCNIMGKNVNEHIVSITIWIRKNIVFTSIERALLIKVVKIEV
jgi:hypothetical protein